MYLVRKETCGETVGQFLAPDLHAAERKVRDWAGHPVKMDGGKLYSYGRSEETLFTIMDVNDSILINMLTKGRQNV